MLVFFYQKVFLNFRPLLKLTDRLLLVGILNDVDIQKLLNMVDPETWDPTFDRGNDCFLVTIIINHNFLIHRR